MSRWFEDRSARRGIPSVSLRRLLPDAQFVGCPDLEVSGCSADSRRVDPGHVFVAIRGARHDGHDFVERAVQNGAAAVVVERPHPEAGRPQVVVRDTRGAFARLCQALAGDPADRLGVVGVTGSTGKTATARFIREIAHASGRRFGIIEPMSWGDGARTHPSGPRTPTAKGLAEMLSGMAGRDCDGAAIELCDRALDRRTFEGVRFRSAVVTSLAGPTDEAEGSRLSRRSRAARLVRQVESGGSAVLNADEANVEILGASNLKARLVTFGLGVGVLVTARLDRIEASGTRFRLLGFDREATVELRLPGRRNVSHALAAAAWARAEGIAADAVVAGLEAVAEVPGRLESVDEGQAFAVRVDRCRTPFDLSLALETLKEVTKGRVHCVVGAEGGQSSAVRRDLARAAERGADSVVLTLNHPRADDPESLILDFAGGLEHPGEARREPDRRRAIECALGLALPGDSVLIAGNGRHAFQILADRAVAFGDREVASRWLGRQLAPRRRSA